jgi:hypothetical protein
MEKDLIYGNRLADDTYEDFRVFWTQRRFDNQRYGQAFCNYFAITDPDLFYSNNPVFIRNAIEKYLNSYQVFA